MQFKAYFTTADRVPPSIGAAYVDITSNTDPDLGEKLITFRLAMVHVIGEPTLKKCSIKGDNRKVAGPTQTMLRFHP